MMDEKTIFWIKQTLANDENSSDEEMLEYFVKEGGLSQHEATRWVALRPSIYVICFALLNPMTQKGMTGPTNYLRSRAIR
jgi:hypothetical protein